MAAQQAREAEKRQQIIQAFQSRSGPLPSPSDLEHYEKLMPGLADRIVKMAESEMASRHRIHEKALNASIDDTLEGRRERKRGQLFAFFLAGFAILLAFVATMYGYPWFGGVLASASIGSICIAFIVGRQSQATEDPV